MAAVYQLRRWRSIIFGCLSCRVRLAGQRKPRMRTEGQFTFLPRKRSDFCQVAQGAKTEQPSPVRRGVQERGRFEIDWRWSSAPTHARPRTVDHLDTRCPGPDPMPFKLAIAALPSRYRRSATSSTFPSPEGEGFVSPLGNSKLSPAPAFIWWSALRTLTESEMPDRGRDAHC